MDKESRKGIIIGLISSTLFLIIVQPSLSFGWNWLINTGSTASEKLSNHLYQMAALGPRNWVVVDLGTFGFALFLSLYAAVFGVLLMTYRKLKKIHTSTEEKSIDTLKAEMAMHESRVKKQLFIFFPIMIVCLLLTGGFTVFRYSADLKLNTSFSNRLIILTPSLTQKEVDGLRADWAKMKNRSDYEAIVHRMDGMAKSASIDLPPPAMK